MTHYDYAQAIGLAVMLAGAAVIFVTFVDHRPSTSVRYLDGVPHTIRSHRARRPAPLPNVLPAALALAVALTAAPAPRRDPLAPRVLERRTGGGTHHATRGRMIRVPLAPYRAVGVARVTAPRTAPRPPRKPRAAKGARRRRNRW